MPTSVTSSPKAVGTPTITEKLRRFLQAYWLRPENALWMTLRSHVLEGCTFEPDSIDVSCGDGVFSFLHLGGQFDGAFDVFGSVDHLDRIRDDHADMFDAANESYRPSIRSMPTERIEVGTDLKPAMLAKARALGLYNQLQQHDNNEPLPFGDNQFKTVYGNAAYWVRNIDVFLRELRRICQSNGRIILHIKLDSLKRYTLSHHEDQLGARWLDIIGRGRVETWPSLADRTTWECRFQTAGLEIVQATPFITRTHAHLWDVGLRPIAPLLVKMANGLTPSTRTAIKKEWVDLFSELLTPFLDPSLDLFPGSDEPGEIQYVLTPK